MKIKVQPDRQEILDGSHVGVIVDVEYRDNPYSYTDVVIEMNGMNLKAGFPTMIAPSSKLGKLLSRFEYVLEIEKEIDVGDILIGKPCQFLTVTEETAKGKFAKVLSDTLKPTSKKKGVDK